MKHFLAYGNSDQASFRDPAARDTFDYMTVPGTIASYFEDATAAFVLSSELAYVIDPRTPLFQGTIGEPRASHHTLGSWMSDAVTEVLNQGSSVQFSPEVYTPDVIEEMVSKLIGAQRQYGEASGEVTKKMSRYRRLLATAMNTELEPLGDVRSPSFILAPYFVARDTNDPWFEKNQRIWQASLALDSPDEVSPVIATMSVDELPRQVQSVPAGLSSTIFVWVSGFDEHQVTVAELAAMGGFIEEASEDLQVVNMYGGFFSICLGRLGLWGMNNGLGYSESRDWPQLPATGAAPPRYYIPRLHSYYPPRLAQLVMDTSEDYWCTCEVCQDRVVGDMISIVDLSYHDVKKHFALTRGWELDFTSGRDVDTLATHLRDEFDRFQTDIAPRLPSNLRPDVSYLHRWSLAIG